MRTRAGARGARAEHSARGRSGRSIATVTGGSGSLQRRAFSLFGFFTKFKKTPSGTRGLSLLCPLIRERRPRLLALISEARRGPRGVVSTCNSTRETLGSFCEHCHCEHHHWTVVMKFQSPENTITTLFRQLLLLWIVRRASIDVRKKF